MQKALPAVDLDQPVIRWPSSKLSPEGSTSTNGQVGGEVKGGAYGQNLADAVILGSFKVYAIKPST